MPHRHRHADLRERSEVSGSTPTITIEKPSRKTPAEIPAGRRKIVALDQTVQIPIGYSTIIVALVCVLFTAVFCVSIEILMDRETESVMPFLLSTTVLLIDLSHRPSKVSFCCSRLSTGACLWFISFLRFLSLNRTTSSPINVRYAN